MFSQLAENFIINFDFTLIIKLLQNNQIMILQTFKQISFSSKLFNIVLSILVLISVLQRNSLISNSSLIITVFEFIELLTYIILLYLIIQNKYSPKILIISIFIGALLFIGYLKSGMAVYFRSLLLILASRRIKMESVFITIRNIVIIGIVISACIYFVQVLFGMVPLLQPDGCSLGFVSKNSIGELFCLVGMISFYLNFSRKGRVNYVIVFAVSSFLLLFVKSKTAAFIFLFSPIIMSLSIRVLRYKNTRLLKFLVYMISPLLFLFAYFTAKLYNVFNVMQVLDRLLTNRIFLNHYALTKYGLTLFGQKVSLHDTGVYNAVTGIGNITVTVDNAYILSLVSLGVIPTLIFVFGYFFLVKKALNEKNYLLIGIAVLLCLYGFTEVNTLDIYDNFVYFSLFSSSGIHVFREDESS